MISQLPAAPHASAPAKASFVAHHPNGDKRFGPTDTHVLLGLRKRRRQTHRVLPNGSNRRGVSLYPEVLPR